VNQFHQIQPGGLGSATAKGKFRWEETWPIKIVVPCIHILLSKMQKWNYMWMFWLCAVRMGYKLLTVHARKVFWSLDKNNA